MILRCMTNLITEYDDKIHVLLDAEYSEPAEAYVAVDPPNDDPRPQNVSA